MSKNVKISNPMKVITGVDTRWSYANVWEPKSINGGTPKYSVSLIIPKSDTKTIAKIQAAIEAAYKEGEAQAQGQRQVRTGALCSEDASARRRCRASGRRGLQKRLLRQRQCNLCSRHRGRRPESDSYPLRSVQRRVRQSQHHVLCFQLFRKQGNRLRAQQPAEDPRR